MHDGAHRGVHLHVVWDGDQRERSDYASDEWASEGDRSPDGTQIVFRYYRTGWDHNELRIVNADGTGERTLWVGDPEHTGETLDWGP